MHTRVLRIDSVKEVMTSLATVADILRRFEHRVLLELNIDACITFLYSSGATLAFDARFNLATGIISTLQVGKADGFVDEGTSSSNLIGDVVSFIVVLLV